MRIELFSLRRTSAETELVRESYKALFDKLDNETSAHIISTTEVDRNPRKLTQAFEYSISGDDSLDGYIFLNATDTKDSSSFVDLFTPLMKLLEEAMECSVPFVADGKKLVKHVNVASFNCEGTELKGYCFYAIGKRFFVLPSFEGVEGISFEDFVTSAFKNGDAALESSLAKFPQGTVLFENSTLTYLKPKGRVKHFIFSFIPAKGDSAFDVIRKLVVLLALGAFITGAVLLLNFYVFMPMGNQSVITEIQNIAYDATEDEVIVLATNDEGEVVEIKKTTNKNWKGLKKVNDEIVAWIKIDGTKIDYPVLEHIGDTPEDQFYLYRNYKKDYSDFGSIFVDYRCYEKSIGSKNLILHGHNMGSDDSMFGQLMNYARADGRTQGNTKFYKTSPTVTLDTPQGKDDYIIFAVMKIDVSNDLENIFDYLKADFDSDARFMNFIYNIKIRSYLDVNVPINENDSLLTLSTCSYETDNMRTIVVARKVRENEDIKPYINTVEKSSPVNVASSSFHLEHAANNTPWYDGKGKLQGDETVEFMSQSKMFTVQFLDANGKVISTQLILEGRDAKAPKENPRKASDGTYYYVFKGWDSVYLDVTKDLTIKPIFTKKKIDKPTQPTTTMPTTAPIETEAPYIEPETEAPEITEAPVTVAPTTLPPQTQAPTTQAPVTEAPTTLAPVTVAPLPTEATEATEAPYTEAESTQ